MENINNEPCGTRNFEAKEAKILSLTQSTYKIVYPIYWVGLNLTKDVINLLVQEIEESNGREKKYNTAYLMLLNRAIQHLESVRVLTERGLYGDSFALIRSLMSDLVMMQYLHFHPELIDTFLNEGQDDYQNNKYFREAFSEATMRSDLIKRGVKKFGTSFQILSKISHASSFGSQFYGFNKGGSKYHLNYGPAFQPKMALMLMDLVATGHYDLITNILWHKYQGDEDLNSNAWMKIDSRFELFSEQVVIFNRVTEQTIKHFKSKW